MPSTKYYNDLDLTRDNRVVNLADPVELQDATNKGWVESFFPATLPGDMVYMNPTGSRVLSQQAQTTEIRTGIGYVGVRITSLVPGHTIRVRYEARSYYGGGDTHGVSTFLTGAAIPATTLLLTPALDGTYRSYTADVVLGVGITDIQIRVVSGYNDVGFRNIVYTDLTTTANDRLPIGTEAAKLNVVNGLPAWVPVTGRVEIGLDGHGNTPQPGVRADFLVPYPMRVTGWTVVADAVGSAQLDLWRAAYADFPPTVEDSVTGTDKPRLASEIKAQSAALTGWVTDWAADDLVRINLDSADTLTRATVILSFNRI